MRIKYINIVEKEGPYHKIEISFEKEGQIYKATTNYYPKVFSSFSTGIYLSPREKQKLLGHTISEVEKWNLDNS